LLRNICGLTEPPTKWNELPQENDYSLEADIVRIDVYRNEIYAHSLEHMALTSDEFEKYWETISDTLCRIENHVTGSDIELKSQIYILKFSRLTNDDLRIIEKHFHDLYDIKLSLAQQDEKLDKIDQDIQGLQEMMIPAPVVASTITNQYNITTFNINASPIPLSAQSQRSIPEQVQEGSSQLGPHIQNSIDQRRFSLPLNVHNPNPVVVHNRNQRNSMPTDLDFARHRELSGILHYRDALESCHVYDRVQAERISQGEEHSSCSLPHISPNNSPVANQSTQRQAQYGRFESANRDFSRGPRYSDEPPEPLSWRGPGCSDEPPGLLLQVISIISFGKTRSETWIWVF
jgi:hypothetical protein